MNKAIFRSIVAMSIAVLIGSVAVLFLTDNSLPPELAAWVEASVSEEWSLLDTFATAVAVVSMGASIGLLFFARWSRPAYAASVVLITIITLFLGPSVSTALETFFTEATLLLDGFIIGLAYFSDVRRHFEGTDIDALATGENVRA